MTWRVYEPEPDITITCDGCSESTAGKLRELPDLLKGWLRLLVQRLHESIEFDREGGELRAVTLIDLCPRCAHARVGDQEGLRQ